YVNVVVWTCDPRIVENPYNPFILFDFQENALLEVLKAIGKGHDVLFEKSRDEGASWLNLLAIDHKWKFFRFLAFGLVSRSEPLVDKKNDPDCLMWKLDLIRTWQPLWLAPTELYVDRNNLSLMNKLTGSSITGASTTSDVNRGGRKTAILMDEFAKVLDGFGMLKATRDATRCRIFNFTP